MPVSKRITVHGLRRPSPDPRAVVLALMELAAHPDPPEPPEPVDEHHLEENRESAPITRPTDGRYEK